jgi:hypothetical protein
MGNPRLAENLMTIRTLVCTAVLGLALAACGGSEPAEEAAVDTMPPVSATPPALTAAQVAGTWNVRSWNEAGDSIPGFTLIATPDPAGWTMQFANRPSMPVRTQFAGDSVIAEWGPYESVLRAGVTVDSRIVSRLQAGKLVGSLKAVYHNLKAVYHNQGADSVMMGRTEGTKAP